ncbi:hypothetical protein JCM3766R1_004522 [Sporobolomyces carnicolor]
MSDQSELPPPVKIAIVGGGIAGLTLACAFHHEINKNGANVAVTVYESARQFGEIGAGVSFGPNAQRALRMVGCGSALDNVAGPVTSDGGDTWFEFRGGEEKSRGDRFAKVEGTDAARGNVHRADFLNQLIEKIPRDVARFRHRATRYVPRPQGGVTLHFSPRDDTGEEIEPVEVDLVVCCDGIKSPLRKSMYQRLGIDVGQQRCVYSEWIAWRGLVRREKFVEAFGPDAKDKMMHCGHGRHLLHFPVRNGELINIVGFVHDGRHERVGTHEGPWSEPRPAEEMMGDFESFNEPCRTLLSAIESASIWGIFKLPLIETVVDDQVVLIGDAAHATTPHQGSGAGAAVEDALFLSRLVSHPTVSLAPVGSERGRAIRTALRVYESCRQPRGQRIQSTSDEAGRLYEFLDPDKGDNLVEIKRDLESRMKWIWEYDTEREVANALDALDKELAGRAR